MENSFLTDTHFLSSQASGRREESPLSHAREGFIIRSDEGQDDEVNLPTGRRGGEEKSREE